jgi:Flp pilus assembly protein CpaB
MVSMRIFLIILLVFSTLGLSGAGFLLLKNRKAEPVVKEIPKTYVMVPNVDLLRGHVIGPGDLVWMEWPSESANNFVSSKQKEDALLSRFNGRVARLEISAKTPILEKNFISKDAAGGLISLLLQPGKRAYTISVGIDTGGAGFIVPGDYVDIVLIQNIRDKLPRSNSKSKSVGLTDQVLNAAAETLLKNVKVIAVGAKTYVARTSSDTEVTPVETITVEVGQVESEKLALAKTMGSLSVVLRSLSFEPDSNTIGYVSDTNASKVLNKVMVEAQKNAEEETGSTSNKDGKSRKKSITIYSGRNVIEQKVSPR